MNFLAHTFLSCRNEKMLLGNFLGDFVKNKDLERYEAGIQEGILLHRKIDTYTDNHQLVRMGTKRLHPYHGKYASVIIDVFYDHFLAINWNQYSREGLDEFSKRVYQVFQAHIHLFPAPAKIGAQSMIDHDWLPRYANKEWIREVLERMERRLSKPQLLKGVMESLKRDYDQLNKEFQLFFPELILYVDAECAC